MKNDHKPGTKPDFIDSQLLTRAINTVQRNASLQRRKVKSYTKQAETARSHGSQKRYEYQEHANTSYLQAENYENILAILQWVAHEDLLNK